MTTRGSNNVPPQPREEEFQLSTSAAVLSVVNATDLEVSDQKMASVSSCQDLGGLWMDLCLFLPAGILTSLHWLIEKRSSDFIFLWTLIILSLRPLRGSVAKQWYHPSFPRDSFEKAEAYLFKFYWISWVNIGTELGQPYFVWDGGHSANFLELGSHFLIWINMSMWLCFWVYPYTSHLKYIERGSKVKTWEVGPDKPCSLPAKLTFGFIILKNSSKSCLQYLCIAVYPRLLCTACK